MKGIVSLFFIFIFLSCNDIKISNIQNITLSEYHIDDTQRPQTLTRDEYSVDRIVSFVMPENVDIVQCDKIIFSHDRCYILDKVCRKVFVISDNGEMICSVGEVGHAVNELFREPTDFSVDSESLQLYLFEKESQKIIVYDSIGTFQKAITFNDMWPYAFSRKNDGSFLFAFRTKESLWSSSSELTFYDKELNRTNCYFELEKNHLFLPNEMPFGVYYDGVSFIPNFSRDVYFIENNNITKGIHISFSSPYISDKMISELKYQANLEPLENKDIYIYNLSYYFENDYWRRVDYSKGYLCQLVENKRSGKRYDGTSFFNGFFPYAAYTFVDDKIVFLVTNEIVEYYINLKNQLKLETYAQLVEASCPEVQQLLDGELKAPCLIYVNLP